MPAKKKAPSCAPRTAVAYARYSSAGQRDVSIEQQLNDIRAFADREGFRIVHEYADHARSGYKNTAARHEFHAMLRDAAGGSFDTVIAWKVDRFGRNRREANQYKGQLSDLGVNVVYAMDKIPDGAAGVLTEGMLEALAEWYSRNLSENVTRGMSDNASKALYNGVKILGYCPGPDHRYQICEPEAIIVRRIFSLYAQGYSLASICTILNGEGFRTPRGKPFSINRVYTALNNESYIGIYHWGEYRIPGGMPAIIDDKLWKECSEMKKKTSRHHESAPAEYLLTGKCFCGHCSALMVGDSGTSHTGATHYYYTCQSKKSRSGCHKKSVRRDALENAVVDFIYEQILTGPESEKIADAIISAQRQFEKDSPIPQLEADLRDVRRKIDNINQSIIEGIWTKNTGQILNDLSDQEDQLLARIDQEKYTRRNLTSRDRILFFLHRMAREDRNDPLHRKYLVRTFINSVTVFDDHIRLVINAVEGVESVPLELLPDPPPGSDCVCIGSPNNTHPNFKAVIVYSLAV